MSQYVLIGIAIGSLLAAWVAAIIAYRSHVITKRNLALAEEKAIGRRPFLVPYLADGFVSPYNTITNRIYAFSISLTNRSDTDNSIANIVLLLVYYRPNQPMASLLLPHNVELCSALTIRPGSVITQSQKIAAHQTISGWVLFEFDQSIINDAIIDSYEIRITDSNGHQSKLHPILIRELVHEEDAS